MELARIIESLSGQIQALTDMGSRLAERGGGLSQTTCSIQEAVQNLARRQGTGARASTHHLGSNPFVGENRLPQGLINTTGSKSAAVVTSSRQEPKTKGSTLPRSGQEDGKRTRQPSTPVFS